MVELKFKVGDLVMYGNKIDTSPSVEKYFMKPAKITRIASKQIYQYELELLNEGKSNWFSDKEIISIDNQNELFKMLVTEQITEEFYKQLLKTLESVIGGEVNE